jgi:Carboxypeptidase regulatory-like domain
MPSLHQTLAITAACLLAVGPGRTRAQTDDTRTIAGQVTDRRGVGLTGAHVDVTDEATGHTTATLARAGGHYVVSGLIVGHRYDMLVRCIGYAPSDQAIVATVSPDAITSASFNISLRPLVQDYSLVGR